MCFVHPFYDLKIDSWCLQPVTNLPFPAGCGPQACPGSCPGHLHPACSASLNVRLCGVWMLLPDTPAFCAAAPSYDFRVQLHTLATKKGFDARPVSGITPDKCMPSPQIELNEPLLVQQDEAEHGHMHPSALLTAADVLRSLMQQGKEVSPEGVHCPLSCIEPAT